MTTATPPSGFLELVVGYDGSVPASRALDAAIRLLQGRTGRIHVVYVAHLSTTVMMSAGAIAEMESDFDEIERSSGPRPASSCAAGSRPGSSSGVRASSPTS